MPNPRSRLVSSVAAASLVALTLVTFYLLRNYGPEKALWRFHDAAITGDQQEIARVTMQSPATRNVQAIEAFLRAADKAEPEVLGYRETRSEADYSILYRLPGLGDKTLVLNWVVVNTAQAGWVIDASRTLTSSPDYQVFANQVFRRLGLGTSLTKDVLWVK